jgi:hypothetical protein
MDRSWFSEESQLKLPVVKQDGDWYVKQSEAPGDTACIFQNGSTPGGSEDTVSVEVVSYRQGAGNRTNYLTVELLNEQAEATHTQQDTADDDDESRSTGDDQAAKGQDEYPEQSLSQFHGTGEYVTVEARIAGIQYVKKGVRDMPDLKGVLKQRGSIRKLPFVVSDETSHPYFEEGKRFRFIGVKDHEYEHMSEVQALITEHTEFVEL